MNTFIDSLSEFVDYYNSRRYHRLRFAPPVRAASQALRTQFIEQCLGILQICGVEALG